MNIIELQGRILALEMLLIPSLADEFKDDVLAARDSYLGAFDNIYRLYRSDADEKLLQNEDELLLSTIAAHRDLWRRITLLLARSTGETSVSSGPDQGPVHP